MTITHIKYGKFLTVYTETKFSAKITTSKISQLENIISGLEYFTIKLNNTVCKKTIKKIEALGFDVDIDEDYGFDFESKLYCSI